jgi:hypothetical protein
MTDPVAITARAVNGEVLIAAEAAQVLGLLLRGIADEDTSRFAVHADAWAKVIEHAAAEAANGG